jgi:hypothetical protein
MSMSMSKGLLIFFRVLLFLLIVFILASCARGVTPDQAANRHYNGCRPVK